MKKVESNKKYEEYLKKTQPKPNYFKNCLWAFIVGGLICTFAQIVHDLFEKYLNMEHVEATSATVMTMIFIGATLTGLGVYDKIGKRAGAGSIIPITGFANAIVAPAMEFKREGIIFGVGAKMFILAGPILVHGILASVIVGFIHYFLKR
ncbi:stage V sporulation protein AC [bacterium AH-315-E09]|nr:stage V sporulation protein AC [bacterium AH-315-E09]